MFGYITINKPEIKCKDYDVYRSFYCGLCRELRERFGITGQLSLTYDMTFVILLLSGLYEPKTFVGTTHCVMHPVRKQPVRKNEFTEYAADMNVLLSYYKCLDDWKDEKKVSRLSYAKLLEHNCVRLRHTYAGKSEVLISRLEELSGLEKKGETDVDRVAGCFGRIMEEILVCREDVWEGTIRRMGFYLGKFIYLLDAFEDVEKDVKSGSYNPFREDYRKEDFPDQVKNLRIMMMAECSREFEKLPIIKYGDILRNILYSGVLCRFEATCRKRKEEREKKYV